MLWKEQFSGVSTDDAAAHLNNFVELCEMQKYKDMDGDIIKLKLFPFSLRGRAKEWLLALPRNSIDSWTKCKDAFIGKYYPPAKIISLRSSIMNLNNLIMNILLKIGKEWNLWLKIVPHMDWLLGWSSKPFMQD